MHINQPHASMGSPRLILQIGILIDRASSVCHALMNKHSHNSIQNIFFWRCTSMKQF